MFAGQFNRYRAQLRLAIRVTVAGLVSFALNEVLNLPQGYWIVLTAVLVVQSSVGGSLKFAIDRTIGTLSGAFYGAVVASVMAWAAPEGGAEASAIALTVGLLPTAFMAAFNSGFRIAPVTVIIVLFSATTMQIGLFHYAMERVAEIALGSVIGLAVSLLVLPARAHVQLAEAAADVLNECAGLLASLLGRGGGEHDRKDVQQKLAAIRAAVSTLETIAGEARRETISYLSSLADPEPLLNAVRRIRHDLVMLNRATFQAFPDFIGAALGEPLDALSQAAGAFMRANGEALKEHGVAPDPAATDAAFTACAVVIENLRGQPAFQNLDAASLERLFALGFTLDQLRRNLTELAQRTGEFRARSKGQTTVPPPEKDEAGHAQSIA